MDGQKVGRAPIADRSINVLVNDKEEDNRRAHSEAREKTGFWGQQAAGCLVFARSTGRLLVAHRSLEVMEPGTWGTWGGAIDADETPRDAVVRELVEESALQADAIQDIIPSFVFSHPGGFKYHNFLVVVEQEYEPQLDDETQGYRWCAVGDWPDDLHPGLKNLLASPLAQQQITALAVGVVRVDVGRLAEVDAQIDVADQVGRCGYQLGL